MNDLIKGLREELREIDRELDDVEYLGSYVDGIKALKAEIEQLKSQLKEK